MPNDTAPVAQPIEPVAAIEPESPPQTVNYESHRRLLNEKKIIQAELVAIQLKERARNEADAAKRGDFEALLKAREDELTLEKTKSQALEERFKRGMKMNAVIEALGTKIDPKWYSLIDIAEISEDSTGEIDKTSVAKVAEALKRQWPEAFKATTLLPSEAPMGVAGGSGKIMRSDWLTLSVKEMVKWKPDQIIDKV